MKRRAHSSGVKPSPVSVTSSRTAPLRCDVRTVSVPPAGMASSELRMRFSSARRSRIGSACGRGRFSSRYSSGVMGGRPTARKLRLE